MRCDLQPLNFDADHDEDHRKKRHHHDHGAERPEGDVRAKGSYQALEEDDYFRMNDEFRQWLQDDSGKFFDELGSEKARKYFTKFVEVWNSGRLKGELVDFFGFRGCLEIDRISGPDKYYDKEIGAGSSERTRFKWAFAADLPKRREPQAPPPKEAAPKAAGKPERIIGPSFPPPGPAYPTPSTHKTSTERKRIDLYPRCRRLHSNPFFVP